MTLLSGTALDPKRFFQVGIPNAQGSSFDLTIGRIYGHDGKEVDGPFVLQPGNMVQVVSAEVFSLDADVTGHVTYKTTLTRIGVWALTVGIVDPGWKGPIATSLLNFSQNPYTIQPGDAFLRVSFFEHPAVPADKLRNTPELRNYHKDVQRLASSTFPPTFLNSDEIAKSAGNAVLDRIRKEAIIWIGAIALVFTLIQWGTRFIPPLPSELTVHQETTRAELTRLQAELDAMRLLVDSFATEPARPPAQ
jgi:deoxycytidine triphosphate deaminase